MLGAKRLGESSLVLTGHWRSCLLLCLIATVLLNAGCAGSNLARQMIPPCPIPSEAALEELRQGMIPPSTELFLSRMEVYCTAIDRIRD